MDHACSLRHSSWSDDGNTEVRDIQLAVRGRNRCPQLSRGACASVDRLTKSGTEVPAQVRRPKVWSQPPSARL